MDPTTYLNLVACIAVLAVCVPLCLLLAAHYIASGGR